MTCAVLGELGTPATPRVRGVLWAVLRALVFLGGGLSALMAAAAIGYSGANPVLVLLVFSLVPLALVVWCLATWHRMGDRWTLAYLGAWSVVVLCLPPVFDLLGILHS